MSLTWIGGQFPVDNFLSYGRILTLYYSIELVLLLSDMYLIIWCKHPPWQVFLINKSQTYLYVRMLPLCHIIEFTPASTVFSCSLLSSKLRQNKFSGWIDPFKVNELMVLCHSHTSPKTIQMPHGSTIGFGQCGWPSHPPVPCEKICKFPMPSGRSKTLRAGSKETETP